MESRGRDYARFVVGFLLLMLAGFAIYAGSFFYQWNSAQQANEAAKNRLVQALKDLQREQYNAVMADTYGGKTPQETLQMYIDAVEKGDYVLASKYFIGDNQAVELQKMQGWPQENISNVTNLLTQDLTSSGSYSAQKDWYTIDRPITIDFKLYPNGIWKIIEI